MGHEVCDAFQHAPWLQHESRKGHPGEVHPYSTINPIVEVPGAWNGGDRWGDETDLSCDIREEMIDPSSSSLKSMWGISA